jgi:hypothetical protein
MTTIDQRILIPVPPDTVWAFISNIGNNARWQADSKSVVFLTSRRSGPGLRWRNVTDTGIEQVIEITAWYDGLGYQYTYIDGVPFRHSSGTLRIQETPDGTVVQWTFNYEMGGLLGGVRDSMGISRRIDKIMSDSLKALWREMRGTGKSLTPAEAKSLMRDAPDAIARAQYKPRHPSAVHEKEQSSQPTQPRTAPVRPTEPERPLPPHADERFAPPDTAATRQNEPIIPEPPVSDEDTRPRPPVMTEAAPKPAEPQPLSDPFQESEPDFLVDLSVTAPVAAEPDPLADTQPIKPVQVEIDEPRSSTSIETAAPAPAADEARFAPTEPLPRLDSPDEEEETVAAPDEDGDEGGFIFDFDSFEPTSEAKPSYEDEPADALFAEPSLSVEPVKPVAAHLLVTEEYPAAVIDKTDSADAEPAAPPAAKSESMPSSPQPEMATTSLIDEPPITKTDSGTVSIWEVFGVPRPSETQEIRLQTEPAAAASVNEDAEDITPHIREVGELMMPRMGLRWKMRRNLAAIRHPL